MLPKLADMEREEACAARGERLMAGISREMKAAMARRIDIDIWAIGAGPGRCTRPECNRYRPNHRKHNVARYTRAVAGEAGVYGGVRFAQADGGIGLSTSQPVTFGIIA